MKIHLLLIAFFYSGLFSVYAYCSMGPEGYEELANPADVILIAEVIDTAEVGKENKELLFKTRFKIWAVLKGDFDKTEWTYNHRTPDMSQYPMGMGEPGKYITFSTNFREEYLVFLKKKDDKYEACTGTYNNYYSFQSLPSVQPNYIEVTAITPDIVEIDGTEMSLSQLKEYLKTINANKPGRGIYYNHMKLEKQQIVSSRHKIFSIVKELKIPFFTDASEKMSLVRYRPALIESPPRIPFKFLDGRTPIIEDHNSTYADWRFSFEADFVSMRQIVEKELLPMGYKITKGKNQENAKEVPYDKSVYEHVVLREGSKGERFMYEGKPCYSVKEDAGWVTLQINQNREIRTNIHINNKTTPAPEKSNNTQDK